MIESGESGASGVLVVGEDALARAGVAALLAGEAGVRVVGQVDPAEAAVAIESEGPEAVLWDLGPHPGEGLEQALDLLNLLGLPDGEDGGPPVLVLLPGESGVAEVLAAGVRGVLFRDAPGGRIAAALLAMTAGLVVVEEALAAQLARPREPARVPLAEPLTPREQEVLGLLSEGLTNRRIAERLGVSEHTAKFHVNAIVGKLGAQSRTDAVVRGARLGLVLL